MKGYWEKTFRKTRIGPKYEGVREGKRRGSEIGKIKAHAELQSGEGGGIKMEGGCYTHIERKRGRNGGSGEGGVTLGR